MWSFSDFQYDFRSSQSTADLLTVVSDKIARAYNRFGAIWAVALDISKAFDRIWHVGLPYKLKSFGSLVSSQAFGLISSFLSNRWLQVVLDGSSSQEYPINAGVPQGFIVPTLFLLYINDLPDDVICKIGVYADTTLYSMCDQEWSVVTAKIEFCTWIWSTRHCGLGQEVALLISKLEKLWLVPFDWSNSTTAIDVKMDGSVLEEKHLLTYWHQLSLLNWNYSYINYLYC